MDVEFAEESLRRLYVETRYSGGHSPALVKAFRKRIQFILAAQDERDLYAWKSLHFEKLHGREPERSIRLNDQWRLIVEMVGTGDRKTVRILGVEDYH
jgi:proteic killer suppression protein